jgi:drug/metabolite transporter (DMT)-like permease
LKSRYYIEGILAAFLFGSTPVFIKKVTANAVTIGIVRLTIASVLMYLIFVGAKKVKQIKLRDWKSLMLIGLVFGLHWVSYFYAVKVSTPSIAILGLTSFGIYLILIGWIFQKKKPSLFDCFTVALAVAGNLIIVPEFSLQNNITLGLLVGLGSAFFFALLPILQQKNAHIPSFTRAFGQYSFGLLFFCTLSFQADFSLPESDWYYLGILALVCTLVAHTLWLRASTELPHAATSIIYYLSIPVAMFVSYLFLGEPMPGNKILGAVLIISANLIGIVKHMKASAFTK